jgi:hypothetical protein
MNPSPARHHLQSPQKIPATQKSRSCNAAKIQESLSVLLRFSTPLRCAQHDVFLDWPARSKTARSGSKIGRSGSWIAQSGSPIAPTGNRNDRFRRATDSFGSPFFHPGSPSARSGSRSEAAGSRSERPGSSSKPPRNLFRFARKLVRPLPNVFRSLRKLCRLGRKGDRYREENIHRRAICSWRDRSVFRIRSPAIRAKSGGTALPIILHTASISSVTKL